MYIMRAIFPCLTALLLAIHAVLGCCWHHAHACQRECGESAELGMVGMTGMVGSDEEADCHHDDVLRGDLPMCGHAGHAHGCEGITCSFLGLARRVSQELTPHVAPAASIAFSEERFGEPVRAAFAVDALLPPVRVHLALQVLLI
jgi:hypothetical protein